MVIIFKMKPYFAYVPKLSLGNIKTLMLWIMEDQMKQGKKLKINGLKLLGPMCPETFFVITINSCFTCCGCKGLWDKIPSFTKTSLIIEKSLINESLSLPLIEICFIENCMNTVWSSLPLLLWIFMTGRCVCFHQKKTVAMGDDPLSVSSSSHPSFIWAVPPLPSHWLSFTLVRSVQVCKTLKESKWAFLLQAVIRWLGAPADGLACVHISAWDWRCMHMPCNSVGQQPGNCLIDLYTLCKGRPLLSPPSTHNSLSSSLSTIISLSIPSSLAS